MSKRLKSDVRQVEKSERRRRNREDEQQHDDQEVESVRKLQSSDIKRREKVHDIERNNETFYNKDYVDKQRRRHRSDDEMVDSRSSGRNDRDIIRKRTHIRDDNNDRRQHTDDKRSSGSSKHDLEREHRYDSETDNKNAEAEDEKYMKAKRAKVEDSLTTRTGGAYIPPARLKMMQVSSVQ